MGEHFERFLETGFFTRRAAIAAGISDAMLRRSARHGQIARIARGVYVVAGTSPPPDPATVALGWRVVVSYQSAVAWWDADLIAPLERLHVTAPRNRGRRLADAGDGVRLHRADLKPGDVCLVRGVPVTSPLRTALDVSRSASLEEAVAIVDGLFRRGLLTVEEFRAAAAAVPPAPGRHRIQLVAALVDPASESVLESLARVLLWRRRLRPPYTQFVVRSRGRFVARVDFAWPALRLALECDGFEFHSGRATFRRDRRRWTALARAGWRVVVVTWADVVSDPDYVAGTVAEMLSAA